MNYPILCHILAVTSFLMISCSTFAEDDRLAERFGDRSMLEEDGVLTRQILGEQIDWSLSRDERRIALERLDDLVEETRERLKAQESEEAEVVFKIGDLYELLIALKRYEVRHGNFPGEDFGLIKAVMEEIQRQGLEDAVHPTMLEWKTTFFEIVTQLERRPAQVRLRVVDQDGEPLEGVDLTLDRSFLRPFRENRRVSDRHTVDEELIFRMSNENSIAITARKEGYYNVGETLQAPRPSNLEELQAQAWADVVLGRETIIDPEEPKLLNVVLELRKKGEIVQLYSPFGELKAHADGSGTIANLRVPEEFRGDRSIREPQGFLKKVEDIKDYIEESKEPKDVFLLVDFEDGQFKDTVYLERGNQEFVYPRKIRLRMGDEEGGFILERAPRDARPMRSAYRLMTEAPEEGYQREIVVSVEDIHSMDDDGYLLFYFKADGHYGKGGFGPMHRMSVDHEGLEWISHSIGFHINPTPGDRNLETGR
ncbi:MAG: hypothetical protein JJT75_14745 [Opitutales bacterium]|nr:hypothetical protein [Opitutales bacterium]